jgi:hypothetical protein
MFMAEEALLEYLCLTAGCKRVLAKVLAGNLPALELHRAMSFETRRRIPMKMVAIEGGLRVEPTDQSTDTYVIELVLEREQYMKGEMHA